MDEILPSYVGIMIKHYKDFVFKQPGFNEKYMFFFVAHMFINTLISSI